MSSMRMLLAMAMMFGGMGSGMSGMSVPRKQTPRKLSPDDIEKSKAKFASDLERQNAERKVKFPKFKTFEVYGLQVIAFSQKNAERDVNGLLKHNNLSIQVEETVEQ